VVIVGAGAAGLSAARSLAELSGEVDVVVLEGRDRTGGRIETTRLPDGTRVDKGASFIHGCNREDNWVFNLANELSNVTLAREYGGYQAGWLTDALWYDLQVRERCS
jgi:protoporphyrinogen oxidase